MKYLCEFKLIDERNIERHQEFEINSAGQSDAEQQLTDYINHMYPRYKVLYKFRVREVKKK